MKNEIIIAENICKDYVQGKIITSALKNVSFSVKRGEFLVLSGTSGSGKTTLLNIIGSLDNATSGKLLINESDITKMSSSKLADFRLHNLGFIFQSYNLFPVLSALENVALPLQLRGLPKGEYEARAIEALDDVGLKDLYKRKPKELSGGQQQRVAIARALVGKPTLILGDEPTANLDTKNSESLLNIMKDLMVKYNTTIILSSHDAMVVELAERSIVLKDGQIISS